MKTLFSPLEQFVIPPYIAINIQGFDFSITKQTIPLLMLLFFMVMFVHFHKNPKDNSLYVIPTGYQDALEAAYSFILSMVEQNIHPRKLAGQYFPLIFSIFLFILSLNLMGTIVGGCATTAQIAVTLSLSLMLFIGMNINSIEKHGFKIFSILVPSNTPEILVVPVSLAELFLYIFKPISLAVRLFCNVMGTHLLIKVIATKMFLFSGMFFGFNFIVAPVVIALSIMEILTMVVQAFIFSMITCMYINDVLNIKL